MEWKLVRLSSRIWLMEAKEAEKMAQVASRLGSPKKRGRFVHLLEVDHRCWFLDAELLGTLETMTTKGVPLAGPALASFLSLNQEEQDARAVRLLARRKDPWRFLDLGLVLLFLVLLGFLLLS